MKPNHSILKLAACTLVVLAAGCSKQEPTAPTTSPGAATNTPNAVAPVAAEAKQTAQQAVTQVQEAATKVSTEATAQDDAVKAQTQSIIDKAKSSVTEKKYTEALDSLKQLSSFKLTPDQQKIVDDLKTQIQKLMSSSTVSNAVGNLLK